jgi:hypothetical protein
VQERHARSLERAERVLRNMAERTPEARKAALRERQRWAQSLGKRVTKIGIAIAVLMVATILFGYIVGPIGMGGLFAVIVATMLMLIFFSVWPKERSAPGLSDNAPTAEIVHRFDSYLVRQRSLLPAPALTRVDAISAKLPLLESRLGQVDLLDPLAQDARRLMGKHLPDLIDRYERVPAAYRQERDGEGLTVEERLIAGLDAARSAIDDISGKLAQQDLNAFETQGRFIESRYKDGGGFAEDVPAPIPPPTQ